MSMSMQEEAISLLAESGQPLGGQRRNREREVSTQLLSVTDHLTTKDAVDFWHRYFADQTNNDVDLEAFCDAIQSEFSTNVFKHVFDDLPADTVVEEDVMSDFYVDLQNKVSID